MVVLAHSFTTFTIIHLMAFIRASIRSHNSFEYIGWVHRFDWWMNLRLATNSCKYLQFSINVCVWIHTYVYIRFVCTPMYLCLFSLSAWWNGLLKLGISTWDFDKICQMDDTLLFAFRYLLSFTCTQIRRTNTQIYIHTQQHTQTPTQQNKLSKRSFKFCRFMKLYRWLILLYLFLSFL